MCFDALGGEQTGILMNCMPPNSIDILYGNLSKHSINGINSLSIIFENK